MIHPSDTSADTDRDVCKLFAPILLTRRRTADGSYPSVVMKRLG